jgi:ABC-type uncharacterized transport system substrate-binding protein
VGSDRYDAAFATFAQERPDAILVAADAFFNGRSAQFATLAARERIASTFSDRAMVAAGGLMSYGADLAEIAHQAGLYTGKFSRVPNLPTCPYSNRPNSILPSTCKPRAF